MTSIQINSTLSASKATAQTVLLVGNPNVGKTTLFNALTGDTARVGNYPGITVERYSGWLNLDDSTLPVELVDVPGCYSLCSRSPEELVALEAVLGLDGNPEPTLAIVVLDAGQLERNLYLALQLIEFQVPLVFALTMMDEVSGSAPSPERLTALFGVPCVSVNGRTGAGAEDLVSAIGRGLKQLPKGDARIRLPEPLRQDIDAVANCLPTQWRRDVERDRALSAWALLSLDGEDELDVPAGLREACELRVASAVKAGRDLDLELVESRYSYIREHLPELYEGSPEPKSTTDWTSRLDSLLLHPVAGMLFFLALMFGIFQSLFAWTEPAIGLVEDAVSGVQSSLATELPAGIISELLTDGVVGGVGNVIVFLPQILLLFFFIGLLEDSGYMARVAYLMDRILRSVGLNGRAFVPMLSGVACAVPAILATRTMERNRDRLLTMMVVPLMSCSARLPVYALLIAALFPPSPSSSVPTQGLLMVGMYLFSTVMTLVAAGVLGRTLLRSTHVPLLLELPRYRLPKLRITVRMMLQRAREFLTEAGTTILAFTLLMWVVLSFPRADFSVNPAPSSPIASEQTTPEASLSWYQLPAPDVEHSYGGRLGKVVEPLVRPLGFDWKLAVGIIGAFSAREVFVSTLGLVFGLEDANEESAPLRQHLANAERADGSPAYPPLVGLSLMVFFALACQCSSTLAVVKRETRSWRWPGIMFVYMTSLAYVASLLVYQLGQLLGFQG